MKTYPIAIYFALNLCSCVSVTEPSEGAANRHASLTESLGATTSGVDVCAKLDEARAKCGNALEVDALKPPAASDELEAIAREQLCLQMLRHLSGNPSCKRESKEESK